MKGETAVQIYKYTPGVKLEIGKCVLALGFFDGVHTAHRQLLKSAKEEAQKNGLVFAVFTFPSENAFKGNEVLYSTEEKLLLFEDAGVEAVILTEFSDVMGISANDFVEKLLIEEMHCEIAVAGFDFRFGRGALGDAALLSSLMEGHGKKCVVETEKRIDNVKVSTTKIKEYLANGEMEKARRFLGMPYFVGGVVKRGNGVGHKLGFPTVNLELKEGKVKIRRGVYRSAVLLEGGLYSAVTNVGSCPTFEERRIHLETYIIDYNGDAYGKNIHIFFLGFLREEKRFDSEKDLILQINVDKNRTIKENGELTWQAIGLS